MSVNLTPSELALVRAVKTQDQWNHAVATIWGARGNAMPGDWLALVKKSGLQRDIAARFKSDHARASRCHCKCGHVFYSAAFNAVCSKCMLTDLVGRVFEDGTG